jgi:hypothetical protein
MQADLSTLFHRHTHSLGKPGVATVEDRGGPVDDTPTCEENPEKQGQTSWAADSGGHRTFLTFSIGRTGSAGEKIHTLEHWFRSDAVGHWLGDEASGIGPKVAFQTPGGRSRGVPYDQRHGFPRAPHVAELLTR